MAITHNDNGYAVRLQVPLATLSVSSSMFQVAQPLLVPQRITQGQWAVNLSSIPAAASVLISFPLPTVPYQIGNTGNNVPRGFQITDVTLAFALSSANPGASAGASAMSFTAYTYPSSGFLDGSPATTSPTAYGGTSSQWLYNEGSSTGASFGLFSPSTTIALITAVPGSGLNTFLNTDNQQVTFEWYMLPGATTSTMTLTIYDVTVHGKWVTGG